MSAPEDLDALAERHATVEQPWPGLLAFGEADRDFFFGRDTEAEDLLDLVTDHRFTTLYGLSGLGKTSLLNAGLFPRLRQRGFLPVRLRLDLEPKAAPASAQILTALLEELQRTQSDAPPPRSDESIWEYSASNERSLLDATPSSADAGDWHSINSRRFSAGLAAIRPSGNAERPSSI